MARHRRSSLEPWFELAPQHPFQGRLSARRWGCRPTRSLGRSSTARLDHCHRRRRFITNDERQDETGEEGGDSDANQQLAPSVSPCASPSRLARLPLDRLRHELLQSSNGSLHSSNDSSGARWEERASESTARRTPLHWPWPSSTMTQCESFHRVLFSRLEERVQATLERTLELAIDKLQLTEKPGRMCGQFDAARRVALAELFNRIRRYE
jgi:hypothetical protein